MAPASCLRPSSQRLEPGLRCERCAIPGDHCGGYRELEEIARQAIPADRPYILLGESFSGPIAISIAASAPGQLRGLVLCCTFARNPRPALAALKPFIGALPFKALPASWLVDASMRKAFNQALDHVTPPALRARMRAVLAVDVSDRLVPRTAAELVAKIKPSTKVVELDAQHFLLQTEPAQAAREIAAFVRLNVRT